MDGGRVRTPNTMVMLEADDCTGTSCRSLLSTGMAEHSESSQRVTYKTGSRQSMGSQVGRLDSGLLRRTPTPTKQVFLTTVRRKDDFVGEAEERPDSGLSQASRRLNGFYGDVQAVTSKLNKPQHKEVEEVVSRGDYSDSSHRTRCNADAYLLCSNKNNSGPADSSLPVDSDFLAAEQDQITRDQVRSHRGDTVKPDNVSDDEEDETSDDDDGDEDDEEVEDKNQAPSQLLMEFLGCLMEKDYKNAEKLCRMILLYEPEHPEALKFQPLIQEKLQQEEEDNSQDESDDDDDDDDDSNSEDSESDDTSSEEDEDEDQEGNQSK